MGPFPRACQPGPHCTAGTGGNENTKATHPRRDWSNSHRGAHQDNPLLHTPLQQNGFLSVYTGGLLIHFLCSSGLTFLVKLKEKGGYDVWGARATLFRFFKTSSKPLESRVSMKSSKDWRDSKHLVSGRSTRRPVSYYLLLYMYRYD